LLQHDPDLGRHGQLLQPWIGRTQEALGEVADGRQRAAFQGDVEAERADGVVDLHQAQVLDDR